MSLESGGCEHYCTRNGDQLKNLEEIRKVKMYYNFLARNKWLCDQSV